VTGRAPRGPLLLRGVAVLLAALAHAGLLAAAFWPRERPPPPPVEAVAVLLSGASGEAEEGSGAPPAPMAPAMEAVAAQPAPEPAAPSAPPPLAEQPPAPEPVLAEAMPPEPVPSAPAEIALPLPAPAPPPMPAAAPAPARMPAPPPPAAPARAALGPVRLGAGVALDVAPGAESRAARPRDVACSDATEYPPELRQAGIGGDVVLRLRLTDKGRVIEAKVAESSGHPQLDEAVQRSIRRCRFDPALRDGVPVWSNLTWRVTFRPY
jgi:protein TonB